MPQAFWKSVNAGNSWYGMTLEERNGQQITVSNGRRDGVTSPKLAATPEERIVDMDLQGVDIQVISTATPMFGYDLSVKDGTALSIDINNEIHEMTTQWPSRFIGLATLPMQDVTAAIKELDRSMSQLGFKGAELDTVVNRENWDEPRFSPFFEAAEEMGAILFYHPQPNNNLVSEYFSKYSMGNSFGVPLEDTLVVATLILGGILERFPDLKICVAHGGGAACFGMGRIDRGWQVRAEARENISRPPSTYQSQLYYDCITMNERALRFLIDNVGIDRVVLGSDWPYVNWDPSPVDWINGLNSLTLSEKEQILFGNLSQLLGL